MLGYGDLNEIGRWPMHQVLKLAVVANDLCNDFWPNGQRCVDRLAGHRFWPNGQLWYDAASGHKYWPNGQCWYDANSGLEYWPDGRTASSAR